MCAVLTEHGQIPMMTNALYIEKHRRIVFVVPPLFVHTTNTDEGDWCVPRAVFVCLDAFLRMWSLGHQ